MHTGVATTEKSLLRLGVECAILALSVGLLWYATGYVRFGAAASQLSPLWRGSLCISLTVLGLCWIFAAPIRRTLARQALARTERRTQLQQTLQTGNRSPAADALSIIPLEWRLTHQFQQTCNRLRYGTKHTAIKSWMKQRWQGDNPLYRKAWYLVIGEAGAGKTQWLTSAGATAFALPGAKAINWYETPEGMFLEAADLPLTTATTPAQTPDSMLPSLLGRLLKKYRPRQPINGCLLTISMPSLLSQTPQKIAQQAKELHRFMEILQHTTGMTIPLRLILTHCDALPGFDAYGAALPPTTRAQPWCLLRSEYHTEIAGSADNSTTTADAINTALNTAQTLVLRNLVLATQAATTLQTQAALQNFPHAFRQLCDKLAHFYCAYQTSANAAHAACLPTSTHNIPKHTTDERLTGIYCVSTPEADTPYFTEKLLPQLMASAPKDGLNHKIIRQQRWRRFGILATLGALTLACMVTWSLSLRRHHTVITDTQNTLHAIAQVAQSPTPPRALNPTDTLTVAQTLLTPLINARDH